MAVVDILGVGKSKFPDEMPVDDVRDFLRGKFPALTPTQAAGGAQPSVVDPFELENRQFEARQQEAQQAEALRNPLSTQAEPGLGEVIIPGLEDTPADVAFTAKAIQEGDPLGIAVGAAGTLIPGLSAAKLAGVLPLVGKRTTRTEIAAPASQVMVEPLQAKLAFGDAATGFQGGTSGEAVEWVAAKQKGLDLTSLARKSRAVGQGFDIQQPVFMGGNVNLNTADVNVGTGKTAGTGIFTSSNSEVANSYAGRPQGNVVKAYVKKDNHITMSAEGANWNDIPAETVIELPNGDQEQLADLMGIASDERISTDDIMRFARESGFSTASIEDVVDIGGFVRGTDASKLGASTITAIFDPSKIRSINAAFDPDKRRSAEILAGAGGLAVGASALGTDEENGPGI